LAPPVFSFWLRAWYALAKLVTAEGIKLFKHKRPSPTPYSSRSKHNGTLRTPNGQTPLQNLQTKHNVKKEHAKRFGWIWSFAGTISRLTSTLNRYCAEKSSHEVFSFPTRAQPGGAMGAESHPPPLARSKLRKKKSSFNL